MIFFRHGYRRLLSLCILFSGRRILVLGSQQSKKEDTLMIARLRKSFKKSFPYLFV